MLNQIIWGFENEYWQFLVWKVIFLCTYYILQSVPKVDAQNVADILYLICVNNTIRDWGSTALLAKHCQRHNGPEDWVHLTKVTSWGHIKNWYTNLDQISSSESRTKHQLQNFKQTSASRLNLKFKILSKPSFRISTKIQPLTKHYRHNTDKTPASNLAWTSTSKSWANVVFNVCS